MMNHDEKVSYMRTKKGLTIRIYDNQKTRSKRRGHNPPTYTQEEIREWLYSQPLFHKLYDNWKRLDFQKEYVPSIDRKEDHIGYTMSNIQLMTWGENKAKGEHDRKKGKIIYTQKKVRQFSIDGEFIMEYHSICEAERRTGVANSKIVTVCKGKRKTAGGYKWKYAKEQNVR